MSKTLEVDPEALDDLTKSTLAFIEDVRETERQACCIAMETQAEDYESAVQTVSAEWHERLEAVDAEHAAEVTELRQAAARAISENQTFWWRGHEVGKRNGRYSKSLITVYTLTVAVLSASAGAILLEVLS